MTDMAKPLGLAHARIEWQDSTPRAPAYQDIYFSADSGLAESRHVFLQGNDLPRRLAAWQAERPFVIGETGFGTGRNTLMAWRLFEQTASASARLHILSIEAHPLQADDLQVLWPTDNPLSTYAQRLLALWPPALRGIHRLQLSPRVTLDLVLDDARNGLTQLDVGVDAWFLDGFAPARNPAMWSQEIFAQLARASQPGATFATYTCARLVRDNAANAGFIWQKAPGFGRKRDMLRAQLAQPASRSARSKRPWFIPPEPQPTQRIAIIGAGIAGSTIAQALARRGYHCAVHDPAGGPGRASGNAQGALHIRLAADGGPRTRFYLAALAHAQRWLAEVDPEQQLSQTCGVLHLAQNDQQTRRHQRCLQQLGLPRQIAHFVDAQTAQALAGAPLAQNVQGGLYYPWSGWVEPARLCRRLLADECISLHAQRVNQLKRLDQGWQLVHDNGQAWDYDQVILACAEQAATLSNDLPPLTIARGQLSHLAVAPGTATPECVLCNQGYVMPARQGWLTMGASFVPDNADTSWRREEDRQNLQRLAGLLPELGRCFSHADAARAALRCISHDRLPYVGAVPDAQAWRRDYQALALDARRIPDIAGCYQPGLWASLAHGSHGLVSAPLAAEVLVSRLLAEPMPLPMELVDALQPGRWLIRELIRGR